MRQAGAAVLADSITRSLLLLVVGALASGIIQFLLASHAAFRERRGIALSIRADLIAITRLAMFRQYLPLLDGFIARLSTPTGPTAAAPQLVQPGEIAAIRVTQDYLAIFHGLAPKLGLLGDTGARVVAVYTLGKGLLEDLGLLANLQQGVLEKAWPLDRNAIRDLTQRVRDLMAQVLSEAADTGQDLERFAARWWFPWR